MIAAKEQQNAYVTAYHGLEKQFSRHDPAWLRRVRDEAITRFAEAGFPTTRNEEWKYTNVAPVANTAFRPVSTPSPNGTALAASLKSSSLYALPGPKLVFVDGHHSSSLSSLPRATEIRIASLAHVLSGDGQELSSLEQHLAQYANYDQHAFLALNTAFVRDGALVEVPDNTRVEDPICLIYVSTGRGSDDGPVMTHPRNLVLVGSNAQVSLIEAYLGMAPEAGPRASRSSEGPGSSHAMTRPCDGSYLTNAVTEIVAGEGSIVEYTKVQQESPRAYHFASVQFHQARSSVVHATTTAFGGALVREDTGSVLDGEGGECTLNGLYVTLDRQHVDNHTAIDHAKPHCGSRELYKGMLDGSSTGVFNGKIIVRKDAQKTDSKQSNKNLLLSRDAVINTKPQLEIYADDVKCTHGATIGQIDAEALFYLRSRGIGLSEARALLTQAFANDVLEKMRLKPLGRMLRDSLLERLRAAGQVESGNATSASRGQRSSRLEEVQ